MRALALVLALAGCHRASGGAVADPDVTLHFVRDGKEVAALRERELEQVAPAETLAAYDPYYKREKRWRALPLLPILDRAFGASLDDEEFVLRARDGYTVPMTGRQLVEPGAYLAVADIDAKEWQPIGPQAADPSPFYLVWKEKRQQDLETHPRPWALATIEIARFETLFPHAAPTGEAPDSPAMRGFAIFRRDCLKCHAINREGGRIGPDLNVPQSIVEYRPEAQVKAYIRNPLQFRYGAMPAHPELTESDLDALIAYFHAMKNRKHDTEKQP